MRRSPQRPGGVLPLLALLVASTLAATAQRVEKIEVWEPVIDGSGLLGPTGLYLDVFRDLLLVADTEGDRIVVLDRNGGALRAIGREGGLQRPVAVAVDREGALYVAERGMESLKILDFYTGSDPEVFRKLDLAPHRGSRPVDPVDVEVDGKGRLYVSDRANRQVLVLGPEGELLARIDRLGEPAGLWTDGEQIMVADAGFGDIRVYGADGRLRRTYGDAPNRVSEPLRPRAIALDRRERVWSLEEQGWIRVLDALGNTLRRIPGEGLFGPSDLVLDRDGRLYVLEHGANRIAVYAVLEI